MDLLEAKELAIKLMDEHGLLDEKWYFEFDNAKRRFGICNYRERKISSSKILVKLNSIERVRNTILHEIAHALTEGHHHDSVWKKKAIEIGCDGKRCYKTEDVNKPKPNYIAICVNGHEHIKHRKPKGELSCGICNKKFNPNELLVWKSVN